MNNHLPKIISAVEEWIPDPHQIVFALKIERNSRTRASMREEKITTTKRRL